MLSIERVDFALDSLPPIESVSNAPSSSSSASDEDLPGADEEEPCLDGDLGRGMASAK
jgi:hypothetical protein